MMTEIKKENVNKEDFQSQRYRVNDQFSESITNLDEELQPTGFKISKPLKRTLRWITEQALLKQFAPAGVLVNGSGRILYIHGHTGLYLEPACGYAGVNNILKMAREGLGQDLSAALYQAVSKKEIVSVPGLRVKVCEDFIFVNLTVKPLAEKSTGNQETPVYLIILEQVPAPVCPAKDISAELNGSTDTDTKTRIALLKKELDDLGELHNVFDIKKSKFKMKRCRDEVHDPRFNALERAKDDLEIIREELENARKALASANQELVSANAEARTINEGLKNSRDELEWVNKELFTINDQVQSANDELATARAELQDTNEKLEAVKAEYREKAMPLSGIDNGQPQLQEILEPQQEVITGEPAEERDNLGIDRPQEDLSDRLPFAVAHKKNEESLVMETRESITVEEPKSFFIEEQGVLMASEGRTAIEFKDASEFNEVTAHGFRHDQTIKTVRIPEGVNCIKRSMFFKCSQLETVILPGTIKDIEDFAFYGCEKLNHVSLENCKNLENIGKSAFEGCVSLTAVNIPENTLEIQTAAFSGCEKLVNVEFSIGSQLKNLGNHVFKDCKAIENLVLPMMLKHIGIRAFYRCQGLKNILLPDGLETIGEYAFTGCGSLKELNISNNKLLTQPGFLIGFSPEIKLNLPGDGSGQSV